MEKTCQYQEEAYEESLFGIRIEIRGAYVDRCMLKPPTNPVTGEKANAARWILSGGGTLAFGRCCPIGCKNK